MALVTNMRRMSGAGSAASIVSMPICMVLIIVKHMDMFTPVYLNPSTWILQVLLNTTHDTVAHHYPIPGPKNCDFIALLCIAGGRSSPFHKQRSLSGRGYEPGPRAPGGGGWLAHPQVSSDPEVSRSSCSWFLVGDACSGFAFIVAQLHVSCLLSTQLKPWMVPKPCICLIVLQRALVRLADGCRLLAGQRLLAGGPPA